MAPAGLIAKSLATIANTCSNFYPCPAGTTSFQLQMYGSGTSADCNIAQVQRVGDNPFLDFGSSISDSYLTLQGSSFSFHGNTFVVNSMGGAVYAHNGSVAYNEDLLSCSIDSSSSGFTCSGTDGKGDNLNIFGNIISGTQNRLSLSNSANPQVYLSATCPPSKNTCSNFVPCPAGKPSFQLQMYGSGTGADCNVASRIYSGTGTDHYLSFDTKISDTTFTMSNTTLISDAQAFVVNSATGQQVPYSHSQSSTPDITQQALSCYLEGPSSFSCSALLSGTYWEKFSLLISGNHDELLLSNSATNRVYLSATCPKPRNTCSNFKPCAPGAKNFQIMMYGTGTTNDCGLAQSVSISSGNNLLGMTFSNNAKAPTYSLQGDTISLNNYAFFFKDPAGAPYSLMVSRPGGPQNPDEAPLQCYVDPSTSDLTCVAIDPLSNTEYNFFNSLGSGTTQKLTIGPGSVPDRAYLSAHCPS
jgi:hypothetical protein